MRRSRGYASCRESVNVRPLWPSLLFSMYSPSPNQTIKFKLIAQRRAYIFGLTASWAFFFLLAYATEI